jgi:hypothetical protein
MKPLKVTLAAVLIAVAHAHAGIDDKTPQTLLSEDWLTTRIEPVTNPIFFEDPQIVSEARPLFIYHEIPGNFLTQGGNVQVYALQLRWAITPRLALIATKDGYIDFHPDAVLTPQNGWANISAGLKYAVIDDRAHDFILTPGFKFQAPTGN